MASCAHKQQGAAHRRCTPHVKPSNFERDTLSSSQRAAGLFAVLRVCSFAMVPVPLRILTGKITLRRSSRTRGRRVCYFHLPVEPDLEVVEVVVADTSIWAGATYSVPGTFSSCFKSSLNYTTICL
eukprot:4856111-Amphidinium_carterae.1